ncbi:cyanophycin synthetase [Variovorax sp. PAMC 28711]|uniref:cyanophycin synthetase n=1 Tax=Variovorax sp. PAMC 28711 TaxID=1795631 RepID=UPI00078E66BF|nr:cyanophycin synthetase [Variovorax sp. PAMC 28711]AMM23953.1 cyanophycin synthetase [Variovorax sp. PAMC 28711]
MNRFDDIQLLRINYLRGPNVWTYRPVLESWLDLGTLEDFPSNTIDGFTGRLTALLPALIEHHCGVGERGGFIQRLNEGTWAGHVLEHVVIELLNLAGMPTGFGQTRSTSKHGVYRMVFRARDEQVARAALTEGHRLLMAAINDDPFTPADVQKAVDAVRGQVEDCYLGPSTACIVGAATDRSIPHLRLNSGNLVQLGYGASQQRIWTAETDYTSAIGESIASDKELTKSLLASCGVPVPEGRVVESAEEAWEAAEDIGLPVAVKPSDANHGRGVSLELTTREEVMDAFAVAEPEGSDVMVERFVRGAEHRLLVVGGQVVAAARGEVITVTGDGKTNVVALIDKQLNSDPRRGAEEEFPLDLIDLATDAKLQLELQRQKLDGASVPEAGRVVVIQRNGNLGVDCTDQVHPEVAHAAVLAARVVGLDIAGIDLVAQDIGRPLAAQGGAIVEVNAGPGLLMHLKPAVGSPRPVGRAICDHLFPDEASGRIPVIGVAGSQDTAVLARLVAWLLGLGGHYTGLACRDGLFLERRRVDARDSAHWEAGHRLLVNRAVQAVVIENGAASILRDGLAYDRCEVGIVTDLEGAGALAEFDITESDQMVKVLRTQVDVVLAEGTAVLNAADPRVAGLAPLCDGAVILYSTDPQAPALSTHQSTGGKAVLVRQDRVVLANGSSESFLPGLGRLTVWRATHIGVSLESLLAAVAAAWALGIPLNLIGAGVEAFEADLNAALASLQLSQSASLTSPQLS